MLVALEGQKQHIKSGNHHVVFMLEVLQLAQFWVNHASPMFFGNFYMASYILNLVISVFSIKMGKSPE
jgi:uncharacterized protein (DUF2062 family)